MLGDFNEVMHPNEVLGGNFHLFRSILLSNMAFVSGLIDFLKLKVAMLLGEKTFRMEYTLERSWTDV